MLGGVQAIRPSKCDLQKKTVWCKLPSYLAERCGKKQKSTTSNCLHPPGTSPFYLEGGAFFQPDGGIGGGEFPPDFGEADLSPPDRYKGT